MFDPGTLEVEIGKAQKLSVQKLSNCFTEFEVVCRRGGEALANGQQESTIKLGVRTEFESREVCNGKNSLGRKFADFVRQRGTRPRGGAESRRRDGLQGRHRDGPAVRDQGQRHPRGGRRRRQRPLSASGGKSCESSIQ